MGKGESGMLSPSQLQQGKMNAELITGETQPYLSRAEKKALKQAREAEKAFRVAKGYEKESFWIRLRRKFKILKA